MGGHGINMESQPEDQIKPLTMLSHLSGCGLAQYEIRLLPGHELVRPAQPKVEKLLGGQGVRWFGLKCWSTHRWHIMPDTLPDGKGATVFWTPAALCRFSVGCEQ